MSEETKPSDVPEAIWPWRQAGQEKPEEDASTRRKRAVIESLVPLTIGCVLFFFTEKRVLARVVLSIGTLVLVGGLFIPPIYHGFRKLGFWLAKTAGILLSWVLLVPFFYLCFPIGRLFSSMAGKDPLERECPTDMKTYWVKREGPASVEQYERQY